MGVFVENGGLEKPGTGRFEAPLRPCISLVYGDDYRRVLRRIIEIYKSSRGAEGASFYRLYKEGVLRSKNKLETVLKTLLECGYVVYEERRARRKSPKKRKDYYPTPLGFIIDGVFRIRSLHSSIEALLNQYPYDNPLLRAVYKFYAYCIINYHFTGEIYGAVLFAYSLTRLYWPPGMTLPRYIEKGLQVALYALDRFLIGTLEEILSEVLRVPGAREIFIEGIKEELGEELNKLRLKKSPHKRSLQLSRIECSEESKDVYCMLLNAFKYLEEIYEAVLKYPESSQGIKDTSQVKT